MTRINVVSVKELSDQWLLAEYRELPRCIKQDINTDSASESYCLGKGHMAWAKFHSLFLLRRYKMICDEMNFRGFNINFPYGELELYNFTHSLPINCRKYDVNEDDVNINRQRLIERYKANPKAHRWTKRKKPKYLEEASV